MDTISNHFKSTTYYRTDQQIAEEKVILGVRFRRCMLIPAAVAIQLCVGSLYAWSGYNLPIETYIYGPNLNAQGGAIDRNIAPVTFYIAVAVFGLTSAIAGPWLERNGPKKGALTGSLFFFIGHIVAAFGVYVKQILVVYLGYGLLGGIGLGISYISPVSPLQKWFPDHRGLAAGFAVCGFGGGSIAAPYIMKALVGPTFATTGVANFGVPLTMIILGSAFFFIMSLSALVFRMPPPDYVVNGISIHTIKGAESANAGHDIESDYAPFVMDLQESLMSREYIFIWIMFFGNEIAGLLIISKLQNIVTIQLGRPQSASMINSIIGAINLSGRILFPLLSDKIGRKTCFLISLVVQCGALSLLPFAVSRSHYDLTITCFFVIAFLYGGGFGVVPAFLSDMFGSKNTGGTHGMILTAWASAGVIGGLIFTAVLKGQGSSVPVIEQYNVNFWWIFGCALFSLMVCVFIATNIRDRRLPYEYGEMLRFRIFGSRISIYSNGHIEKITAKQEQIMWESFINRSPNRSTEKHQTAEAVRGVKVQSAARGPINTEKFDL